jgi:PAS domain S-box-containing protein
MIEIQHLNRFFQEAVIQAVPCAVFVVDVNKRIIFWNKPAEELTGYTASEMVGSECSTLRMNLCSTDNAAKSADFCPLKSPGKIGEVECEINRKDGSTLPVMRKARAVYDDKGQVIGAIEAMIDVSLIRQARTEIRLLKHEIAQSGRFGELVGSSKKMRELYSRIELVAATSVNVVIEGETGTGKELVARAIHRQSNREHNIFLPINCGALPQSLLEAELFGHVRGAFTGAVSDRVGSFEKASGGTLFLDEVSELSPASQVKLLRVLQEQQITKVGESTPRNIDVRIIAASNKNLLNLVKAGQFREDLYYRLHVMGLNVPALREHKEDICDLVGYFIRMFNKKYDKNIESCTRKALHILELCQWPGNIRQLEHAVEHAFILTSNSEKILTEEKFPPQVLYGSADIEKTPHTQVHENNEKEQVRTVLKQTNGNKTKAAKFLGITRTGLYKKMKRLDL